MVQRVVFQGQDASGQNGLWVTDGTVAGTTELQVSGASASGGFSPSGFISYGSKVLFGGQDANGLNGLWVTDGTNAGTTELQVSGASTSGGLSPSGLIPYDGKVLFEGQDASGLNGLWVTDGTAAGTTELQVSGASTSSGLSPSGFTSYGGKVLFQGLDESNRSVLWVTDGTAAGTTELQAPGSSADNNRVLPGGFIPYGGKVLYGGPDASDYAVLNGLWVTDGTVAGTTELQVSTLSGRGLQPGEFTLYNGKVLFEGLAAGTKYGLWVTDGTTAGTTQLQVFQGFYDYPSGFTLYGGKMLFGTSDGLWVTDGTAAGTTQLQVPGTSTYSVSGTTSFRPSSFTPYGGKVLFQGRDASFHNGLWVTDGTAAGTTELQVPGLSISGDPPSSFTLYGGKVLFQGQDASGRNGLWVTDGTAAGTTELQVSGASTTSGLSPSGFAVVDVTLPIGNPVLSSPKLTVAENAASTALGIAAPYDPNYATGQLAITATGLPGDGTLTLADGTAVTAGQVLTSAQLTSLQFKPTPGLFNISSAFVYTVNDPAGNASTANATLAIGPAVGSPALPPATLALAENAASTALGVAAPTDPNYVIGQLTITAATLPSNGTVTLADGTAVVAGQMLSSAQLAGLQFKPAPGLFNASSAFTYTVSDPANNAATGTATLAIGPAVGNPVPSSLNLTVAENADATALGITAPTDPNYATGHLTIIATGLPSDGAMTLADGTAVTAGQALTGIQLTGLRFKPTPGLFNAKSTFAYTVSDPAGNASTAAATLAIGLPPTPVAEFDAAYYLQNNPDVAKAKVDPLKHFETTGWKEGRNPDAIFNTRYYLNQNPDVAAAKVNPLTHYQTTGWKEGRDPSVNFSTAAYLKANPDIAKAGIDPLRHYIEHGSREGRMVFAAQPHGTGAQDPLVDNAYYFSKYSDVSVSGVNPFTHYDTVGWHQGRNPDALFDTNYYLQRNPDVKAAGVDPLLHYERTGWKEGRDPSAQFSTSKYLAANADVKAAGLNPLVHYEQHGIQEGRSIFHV